MNQIWKYGLETPPKPVDFPIIGKLPIDNQLEHCHCHYFIINAHKKLQESVGKDNYLWKSIENDL